MIVSMKSNIDLLAQLEGRFETEKYQEDLKEMREEMKSGQAEMRSTVCAMRPALVDTTSFNEVTETKPDPGMMQSICLQKCSDPKKLWTVEDIDHHRQEDDHPCNSGMAQ
jgi:signal transduction histidine kinase